MESIPAPAVPPPPVIAPSPVVIKLEEEGGVTCEVCGKAFTQRTLYMRHKVVHQDPKHQCEQCGRAFVREDKLKRHIRSLHTLEKPFVCEVCGKAFARKDKLHDHSKHHNRDRNYPCSQCNQAFVLKADLTRHLRAVHQVETPNTSKSRRGAKGASKPAATPGGAPGGSNEGEGQSTNTADKEASEAAVKKDATPSKPKRQRKPRKPAAASGMDSGAPTMVPLKSISDQVLASTSSGTVTSAIGSVSAAGSSSNIPAAHSTPSFAGLLLSASAPLILASDPIVSRSHPVQNTAPNCGMFQHPGHTGMEYMGMLPACPAPPANTMPTEGLVNLATSCFNPLQSTSQTHTTLARHHPGQHPQHFSLQSLHVTETPSGGGAPPYQVTPIQTMAHAPVLSFPAFTHGHVVGGAIGHMDHATSLHPQHQMYQSGLVFPGNEIFLQPPVQSANNPSGLYRPVLHDPSVAYQQNKQ